MKKALLFLALGSLSVFAHAKATQNSDQMLAQIDNVIVYAGENVDSSEEVYETINSSNSAGFENCAVYLPEGELEASTTITLRRTEGGFMLECGSN
ncbi:conserved exported hypothetical protein [Vibrio chagasii]|nr:conserved exported hypothetical protein [Vibrio chagasii]CAH6833243.1 conserved exported hypothetical protein [Vibrio chagasii]CAH6885954.1 conserved exported hypothetical protein [Vibrio chagasii]CAH6889229.1 conserved exported hypothetical protein [Vibrio chagasii]CAH6942132.1 conserved exported hypothetical protein [Vibrio chagasii]